MTLTAFLLIFISVFLHAGWNLLSKATKPSASFYFITTVVAAVAATPFLFLAGIAWDKLPGVFWNGFALTVIANIVYYIALFLTYRRSDISMAYPLIRALPVLLTVLVTLIFGIGKRPAAMEFAGMGIVFAGCLMIPLEKWSDFRLRNYLTPALGTILIAACGITGYTVFDSLCIPLFQNHAARPGILTCGAYMALLEWFLALGLFPVLFLRSERKLFDSLAFHSAAPYLSGLFTLGAYLFVLLAMPMVTNVSFVQAFRQMGLPLGVAGGVFLLHEKCSAARIAGICAIVCGLILLAFC